MSYDPTIGRFISLDPLEFEGGDSDLYRYVHNDPTNRSDPTGLSDKGNTVTPTAPPGAIVTTGPNELPSYLPGKWDIYIRASHEHAWICYVNVDTGEKRTFGRYPSGAGSVTTPDGSVIIKPAIVPGVQMNNDWLKEGNDYPYGVATRPPIRLTDPKVYGGTGYDWKTNNCTTYARDTWKNLSGEYYSSTGPFLIYDDPKALRDWIVSRNRFEEMNNRAWQEEYWRHLNDHHYGPN